ncbi:MAG: LacI family transcriptional regulator [Chloroflexi bacterium]|nr:LacI family transcriptional regulator [Chloroflexota bacterium]
MAVTIKDIARRTGKSITTVSRALADYDDVSPATKELVRRVADEMGYTPNRLAQRLQKRRTETIGLILPTFGPRFADPFFSELLAGIGNTAASYGYDLLVSTQAPGEKELETYRQKVQGGQVDGLIVVRTRRHDKRIDYLRKADVPFAVFGRTEDALDYPFVDEDGEYGMQLMVEHLVDLGHRRIACIAPPPHLMFAHYRMLGIHKAMEKAGLALQDELLVVGDLTQRGGYQQAERLLDLSPRPSAIIACNDLMALGAMSAAQKRGLVVGRDITITGFDDIPMAEHAHPPLTTVHQPIYKIGSMVCDMLLQILSGQEPEERQVILKPKLIVRQSSGAVA